MIQLFRPVLPNFPYLFSTFHLEYPRHFLDFAYLMYSISNRKKESFYSKATHVLYTIPISTNIVQRVFFLVLSIVVSFIGFLNGEFITVKIYSSFYFNKSFINVKITSNCEKCVS